MQQIPSILFLAFYMLITVKKIRDLNTQMNKIVYLLLLQRISESV